MRTIPSSELQDGMVLARDLKDKNGRILLLAGNEVQSKHFRLCKIWGITEATIETDSGDPALDTSDNNVEAFVCPPEVAARFRHTDPENPAIQELKQLAAKLASGDVE